jgi:hypothetical protein
MGGWYDSVHPSAGGPKNVPALSPPVTGGLIHYGLSR